MTSTQHPRPPATFTPCKNHNFKVVGFDIHIGTDQPTLPAGYEQLRGAPAGSGPAATTFDIDETITDALLERFAGRPGSRASEALDDDVAKYALMMWPGLGELATELRRQFPADTPNSAMSFGPVWHLWFGAVAMRTTGVGADQWLSHHSRFDDLAELAVEVHGWELAWHPGKPYRVGIQEYFRKKRLPKLDVAAFRAQLRETGGSLTRGFGQYPTGVTPDPTRVDPRHIAETDGTIQSPQTKVRETVTRDDGFVTRIRTKSKAVDPLKARVDPVFGQGPKENDFFDPKDAELDAKQRKIGRNTVFVVTQVYDTPGTRVILDVARVPAGTGEEPVARDAIIDLSGTFHGAMQMVSNDMALSPRSRDLIFNATGVIVVSRNRSEKLDKEFVLGGPAFGSREPRHRLTHSATAAFLARQAGTDRPEMRRSTHALLGHVKHLLDDGSECVHLLGGDDGNMVELFDDDLGTGVPYPSVIAPFDGSVHRWIGATPPPHDARHVELTGYRLRCAASRQTITMWLEHRPVDVTTRTDLRPIENYVRSVPEPSPGFTLMHGVRQNPESNNFVFKADLKHKHHGRAPLAYDLPAWWVCVGFASLENSAVWFRHTDLYKALAPRQ